MNSEDLRLLQTQLKEHYRKEPGAAMITLKAFGRIGEGLMCRVETGKAIIEAGLHPATGGDGLAACSGDMLLEALAACAGVTIGAVATAIGVEIRLFGARHSSGPGCRGLRANPGNGQPA